jgi:hypothetical protein
MATKTKRGEKKLVGVNIDEELANRSRLYGLNAEPRLFIYEVVEAALRGFLESTEPRKAKRGSR